MAHQPEGSAAIMRFRNSLAKVVELGYGGDECEDVILLMFEDLIRQAVPCADRDKLSFALPLKLPPDKNTHAHLLSLTTEVLEFVGGDSPRYASKPRACSVIFPFLTTLGLSGGMFLLAFHAARLAPIVLNHVT